MKSSLLNCQMSCLHHKSLSQIFNNHDTSDIQYWAKNLISVMSSINEDICKWMPSPPPLHGDALKNERFPRTCVSSDVFTQAEGKLNSHTTTQGSLFCVITGVKLIRWCC